VEKGAPLLILEAMKMEHTITAPAAGTVKAFCYAAGEQVGDGAALVEFESESRQLDKIKYGHYDQSIGTNFKGSPCKPFKSVNSRHVSRK
jgi:pyruvate/2-oxoglutarate dehydrogenase complex dihydrolipoamide acyltransferase (E2) component